MGEDEKRAALRKYSRLWRQGKGDSPEAEDTLEYAVDNGAEFLEVADLELRNMPKRKRQQYFDKLKGQRTSPHEQWEQAADLKDLQDKYNLKW